MNEYLALGHMREISQKTDDETPNCYIPYHMVINEKSTTTKCRVVFNASSKTKKWVAFAADIEKMYRQILISDEDCKYQRIVWRATPSDSLKSFELQTITYGADTEVEAKSIIIEIQNLLKSGGFILRKWSSSHPKVLQDLDTSLLASKPLHSLGDEESKQRVLGLIWNLKTDSIQVKVVHEEIMKMKFFRVGGRLTKQPTLSFDHKFPIIIPKHHPITTLVIRQFHLRGFHSGTQMTLSLIRQHYWIPDGRSTVR
ncbi:uncharacterized protein TNCV_2212121 [Trichonephila clavipes]|nr:uncharacterized protein TNCV_2212121 [Trichonephila clavipes]